MRRKKLIFGILIALAVAAVALFPVLDADTYHQLILGEVLVNVIIVLGLNFITGLTGQMNLGAGGIRALGAYSAILLRVTLGVPTRLTASGIRAFASRASTSPSQPSDSARS